MAGFPFRSLYRDFSAAWYLRMSAPRSSGLTSAASFSRIVIPATVPVSVASTRTTNTVGVSADGVGTPVDGPPSSFGRFRASWPSGAAGRKVKMKNARSWNDMSSIGVIGRSGSTRSDGPLRRVPNMRRPRKYVAR